MRQKLRCTLYLGEDIPGPMHILVHSRWCSKYKSLVAVLFVFVVDRGFSGVHQNLVYIITENLVYIIKGI